MAAQTKISVDRQINIPRATSAYPQTGSAYARPSHFVSISPRVIRTGKNPYDPQKLLAEMIEHGELPSDARFMSQAEGRGIERSYLMQGKDPRKANVFGDYFGKNKGKWFARERTSTILRVPEGLDPSKYEADGNGNPKYRREIVISDISRYLKQIADPQFKPENWRDIGDKINTVVVELHVPSSGVVVEYDDVYGIPIETRDIPWPHTGHYSYFWFNPNSRLDEASGHHDAAVERWGNGPRGERRLNVGAGYWRLPAHSYAGFRPVRGSGPMGPNVDSIGHNLPEKPNEESGIKLVPTNAKPLTRREHEVLTLLTEGNSIKEVAGHLGISENTVKSHLSYAMVKLHASNRTHAVVTAVRRGLLTI